MPAFPDAVSATNVCSRTYIGTGFAPPPGISQVGNWTMYQNSVTGNLRLSVSGGPFIDWFGPGGLIGGGSSLQGAYNLGNTIVIAPGVPVNVSDPTSGTALLVSVGRISCPQGASAERFGALATASALRSLAVGNNASATNSDNIAIGSSSSSGGQTQAIALGSFATITGGGFGGIAIGFGATAGDQAVTVGRLANAFNQNGIAVGQQANANETGTAIGYFANANVFGGGCVAVGFAAFAGVAGATSVGSAANSGTNCTTIGNGATSSGSTQCVAVGRGALTNGGITESVAVGGIAAATACNAQNSRSVAVGAGAQAPNVDCVAVGRRADCLGGGPGGHVSVGSNARCAGGNSSIAIGFNALCAAAASNSIAIGVGATATAVNQLVFGAVASAVNDMRVIGTPQVGLGAAAGVYGGAVGVVLSMPVVAVAPAGATAGVGILFVNAAGGLSFKGAAGTVTAIAPA